MRSDADCQLVDVSNHVTAVIPHIHVGLYGVVINLHTSRFESMKSVFILGISGGGGIYPPKFEIPPQKNSHKDASGGSRICQRGADHGERVEREPKRGNGAEPPAGSRGRATGGGSGGRIPLKLKAFLHFYAKKWPKIKDLSENLRV